MLIPALISALTATTVLPRPWTCDLAPSFGQGTADEGRIDGITTVTFGCRYRLVSAYGINLSPVLGIDKQMWSVHDTSNGNNDMSSYETQDFTYGFRLDTQVSSRFQLFYGLAAGQGKGTLDLTQSTAQSSLNRNYSGLKQTSLAHSLGATFALTDRVGISLGWQRQTANQTWSTDDSEALLQTVDESNHLSLTSGELALTGQSQRSSSHTTANLVQVGISMSFGNR